jgi:hypothetical protein
MEKNEHVKMTCKSNDFRFSGEQTDKVCFFVRILCFTHVFLLSPSFPSLRTSPPPLPFPSPTTIPRSMACLCAEQKKVNTSRRSNQRCQCSHFYPLSLDTSALTVSLPDCSCFHSVLFLLNSELWKGK